MFCNFLFSQKITFFFSQHNDNGFNARTKRSTERLSPLKISFKNLTTRDINDSFLPCRLRIVFDDSCDS